MTLRFARPEDSDALLEIYRPYVETTSVTFESQPPSPGEFRRRVEEFGAQFPYLICESQGEPVGYAYAHPFHTRDAYRWTVETSIYVRQDVRGNHIGSRLYGALLPLLSMQGVETACAVVTIPNERSLGFHHAMGFETGGVLPDLGFKLGQWHHVAYLWRRLHPKTQTPAELVGIHALPQAPVLEILRNMGENF